MNLLKTLRRRTPLGWRQLTHSKSRLLTAIAGIAFADILIFMQLGFEGALYDLNTALPRQLNADIVLLSKEARNLLNPYTFSRRRLYQALDIDGVIDAQPLYIKAVQWRNPQTRESTSLTLMGQNPDFSTFKLPEIEQQRDLLKQPNTLLMDRKASGEYEQVIAAVEAGELVTTEMDRTTVTLGGLFTLGASFASDGTLIASDQTFLRMFPGNHAGSINVGLLRVQPDHDIAQIKQALVATLPDDVKVYTAEEYLAFELNEIQTESPIGFIFGIGSAMGFVVGIIIVYQVLATDVSAHMGEYATFRAMGYRQQYLLGVVFEEAVILSILGFVPSVGVAMGLYQLTTIATALPLLMTTSRVVSLFLATIMMCVLSGAIATRKLQSADPADIF